jgi:hypothetical protein
MDDKRKDRDLMDEIKKMEAKERSKRLAIAAAQAPAPSEDGPEKVEFEVWHQLRSKMIPGHHMKEILKADFKARGLGDKESMDEYDKALGKYGVKLA